jgi:RHH-type proline utilization regulon transcriptional repressor/proline dehydrogenase/delta 1-pyrroline-5-carboxylate dehydrogenase
VHQIGDSDVALTTLTADPLAATAPPYRRNTGISRPPDLFGARRNARALDLSDEQELGAIAAQIADERAREKAQPLGTVLREPADRRQLVGAVREVVVDELERLVGAAQRAAPAWALTCVEARAACLERGADLMEERMPH